MEGKGVTDIYQSYDEIICHRAAFNIIHCHSLHLHRPSVIYSHLLFF